MSFDTVNTQKCRKEKEKQNRADNAHLLLSARGVLGCQHVSELWHRTFGSNTNHTVGAGRLPVHSSSVRFQTRKGLFKIHLLFKNDLSPLIS